MPRHLLVLGMAAFTAARDPYTALPGNYSIELDNAYVRVSRVRCAPGDRLPEHWFDPKKGSAQLPDPVPKGPTVIVELLTEVRAR